jgi:alpha-L-rhamnosidase
VVLPAGKYEISCVPSRDYRCVYGPETRLSELEKDEVVMGHLEKELPPTYGIIRNHDKEIRNHILGELPFLFFMGFTPEKVGPVNEKIFNFKRW